MSGIANAAIMPEPDEPGEIEITEKMVEAGVAAIASYNPKFDMEEDGAIRVYRAMVKATVAKAPDAVEGKC